MLLIILSFLTVRKYVLYLEYATFYKENNAFDGKKFNFSCF